MKATILGIFACLMCIQAACSQEGGRNAAAATDGATRLLGE